MENVISKELLSQVLGVKINDIVNSITTPNNLFEYEINTGKPNHLGDDTIYRQINIHELSHKCKEWARNKHYIIVSALINNKDTARAKIKYSSKKDAFLDTETEYFNANTESEAIFLACEYILNNIKQ